MNAHAAIKNTFLEDFFVQKCLTIIPRKKTTDYTPYTKRVKKNHNKKIIFYLIYRAHNAQGEKIIIPDIFQSHIRGVLWFCRNSRQQEEDCRDNFRMQPDNFCFLSVLSPCQHHGCT